MVADIAGERCCVFRAGPWNVGRGIAERLRGLAAAEPPCPAIEIDRAVPGLDGRVSVIPGPSQR